MNYWVLVSFVRVLGTVLGSSSRTPWVVLGESYPDVLTSKHVILSTVVISMSFNPHTTLQNSTTRLYHTLVELTKIWGITICSIHEWVVKFSKIISFLNLLYSCYHMSVCAYCFLFLVAFMKNVNSVNGISEATKAAGEFFH